MRRPVIGVDARYSLRGMRRGIGEYVYQLARELADIPRSYDLVLYGDETAEPEVLKEFQSAYQVNILRARPFALWEQLAWPQSARADGITILHGTANISPLMWRGPLALTVMDAIEWHRGKDFPSKIPLRHHLSRIYRMNTLKRVIHRASLVLTISNHAKVDLVQTLRADASRIQVIPLAAKLAVMEPRYDKKPYFLALGALDPRKNLEGAMKAFGLLKRSELRLKVVGLEPEALPVAREMARSYAMQSRVDLEGMISDEDLRQLYQEATGFLYLSLYEGFGLPLLEAMALGCPVISSDRSALPEVAGQAAVLVDPEDAAATAAAMSKLADDGAFRRELIGQGQDRVKLFDWTTTAKMTHEAYLRLVDQVLRSER